MSKETNPNKMKWCEKGRHSVPVLFHSKKADRESCCKSCYRPEIKVGDKINGFVVTNTTVNKGTNTATLSPVSKSKKRPAKRKKESVPELLKLAEIVFNRFIRNRDKNPLFPAYFTCISCGLQKPIEVMQAGHYAGKNYSQLRFNENNVNGECETCNCHDKNHLIGYRKNLIDKIGIAKVRELELVPFAKSHKWERDELLEIINKYKM